MYISGARVSEVKMWQTFIHFLIVLGSCNGWLLVRNAPQIQKVLNDLCSKLCASLGEHDNFTRLSNSLFLASNEYKPVLSSQALNALFSIIMKFVRNDDSLLSIFITHVLTCPAIILHLNKANLDSFLSSGLFDRSLTYLRASSDIVESIEPQKTINLLGNVVHLGYLDEETVKGRIVDWTWVIGLAMAQCTEFAVRVGEQSSHNHWHPIFGHYKLPIDPKTERSLRNVLKQLQMLWSYKIVCRLFDKALEGVDQNRPNGNVPVKELGVTFNKLWKKLGGGSTSDSSHTADAEKETPPTLAAVVCQLYMTALSTMTNMKNEIIAGVCREDRILRQLWGYLVRWGVEGKHSSSSSPSTSSSPLNAALALLSRPQSPHAAPLRLFADAASIVISILDEEELYEQAIPFPLEELVHIARFCNYFCFRAVWNGYVGLFFFKIAFVSFLRMIAYRTKDFSLVFINSAWFFTYETVEELLLTIRSFGWLRKDVKSSVLMVEFEKKTSRGLLLMRRLSHLVSLKERMLLFRKFVSADKANIESTATLITVARNRLVEDGYRQLSMLSTRALKSTIRVKFVNQQGLDEAGIDQDGVFKEFLELTIKQVFDPALNLFHSTAAGVLYPSSTSSVHEDHLALFQFVGRILAKAVYEGIVVDVQLAPVLLAAVRFYLYFFNVKFFMVKLQWKLYAWWTTLMCIDELSQLDPELYRNLTFVKKYNGDVSDLSLTFSIDEDFMGKINTVDLIPGGRTIQVTNENKIDYVHRMAHHRVFSQTKQQCRAFVAGAQSVLNPAWLFLFAPHELQFIISGYTSDIDMADLKKHVQYYGGFHGSHRLIKWLWEIVEKDFTPDERRLFLKFVTSCSRPPLLGFSYLEPPFSIRCVEVSDDQDQGDTLGSVVRGFLALKKSQSSSRLPTASTCFNLLKLPNYNKKSVLLSKLRYAIHSETGFELS
ncbi:HECT-domain protein [Necator americanus]|uniref:Ubiquitin-protein ligase E3B n=1 Tax=Necator americanus TaxID=51031 RepID=W2TKH0_NECAM|nr:HECT-domain protein [Necator americanus]ETN82124.1 HECT-domain protein [Necator americanus]